MKKYLHLNGSQLKWLAIITMFFDHAAKIIGYYPMFGASMSAESLGGWFPLYQTVTDVFLFLGRLAFPIFCFLLVEGFLHTSNIRKYALRLAVFAFLSEIPFDLAFFGGLFNWQGQNVFFTLLIGLLTLIGLKNIKLLNQNPTVSLLASIAVAIAGMVIAELLHTDYGGKVGVLLIIALYVLRNYPVYKCLAGALIMIQSSFPALLSFPLIYLYNGQRGRQGWKYFFYVFYPVHLLLLIAVQKYALIPYLQQLFSSGS